jgi:hypothetical protein
VFSQLGPLQILQIPKKQGVEDINPKNAQTTGQNPGLRNKSLGFLLQ